MVKKLDVRKLPAPEPLAMIFNGLSQLKDGEILFVVHRQEPCALFPRLSGYNYKIHTKSPDLCEFYIWKQNDLIAEEEVKTLVCIKS